MAEGETQVPGPLGQNEPELLAPGGVRAPAVRLLFPVFVREHRLKRAAMQIQGDHISRRERACWQGGVEQLVDDLATRSANGSLGRGCLMRGNDDPCAWTGWRKSEIREVKESSNRFLFRNESSADPVAEPGGLAPTPDSEDHSPCLV